MNNIFRVLIPAIQKTKTIGSYGLIRTLYLILSCKFIDNLVFLKMSTSKICSNAETNSNVNLWNSTDQLHVVCSRKNVILVFVTMFWLSS